MSDALWNIPKTWIWTEMKDLGKIISGGTPSTKEPAYWGDEVNWISPSDLTGYNNKTIIKGAKNLTLAGLKNSSAKMMPAGSVHFSSRAPIGYVAISSQPLCTNQGFKSLVPSDGVFNEYAYYYLKASKYLAEERATGTTFKEISGTAFGKLPFPLPPSNEQKRIVAKIEELFSELDSGIESLKTAREQLKVYRQAVLKHAFEGKLTAEWREKKGINFAWKKCKLSDVAEPRGEKVSPKVFPEYDFIGMDHVESDSTKIIGRVSATDMKSNASRFYKGDIIYGRLRPYLNKVAQLNFDGLASAEFIVFPESSILHGGFLKFRLNSRDFVAFANSLNTGDRPRVNFKQIGEFSFMLPSIGEQQEIFRLIEKQISAIESIEATIDAKLHKSEALRQSILKKAFSGQLVAQDPADEPASVLLERIKTQKIKPAKTAKNRKKNAPIQTAIIIPFPHPITAISMTDLHAGIIGLAYDQHEQHGRMLNTFGHVKAEKIAHLVEYQLGIPLGRQPVKDAAGPNDYRHLKKVEHRANKANWFSVQQRPGGKGYIFVKKREFNALLTKTTQALKDKAEQVEKLIHLFLPLNTQRSEIIATLYAAWNNLLITRNTSPTDEEIVTESRENWHVSKLNIERDFFFQDLKWLREKQLIPKGIGLFVDTKKQRTT